MLRRGSMLVFFVLLLSACARTGRATSSAAPGADAHESGAHTLRGRVVFEAAYEIPGGTKIPRNSEVPRGHTGVRGLRVCLYEQHGRNDFDTDGAVSNDVQIACRDTDAEGWYELGISKAHCHRGGDCSARYYLVTQLCAWSAGRPQVCVTANTIQEKNVRAKPLTKWAEYRKLLWSETYRISLTDRTSNIVSWNLSCPAESGLGRPEARCERVGNGGRWDRKNSNYGHTKEAVHAFYGASNLLSKVGTFIPTPRNTLAPRGKHCGGPGDRTEYNWQCQDAVRIVVRDMRKFGMEGDRHCARRFRAKYPNWFYPMRSVCLGWPLHPFSVPHEVGHVLMARWLGYRGAMNGGPVNWRTGTPQKSQVGEGWADFVAAYAWFPPDETNPSVSGWAMEDVDVPRRFCVDGMPRGELHAAQFFWDLYDAPNPAEPGDDVQLDLWTMLRVWSMFGGKTDGFERRDHTRGECNPHGRNIKDYLYYFRRFPGRSLPSADGLVRHNCLTGHVDGMKCE